MGRSRLRGFVVGSSALASVAALVAGTVLPVQSPAMAESIAFANQQQSFSTGGLYENPVILDAIPAAPAAIVESDSQAGSAMTNGVSASGSGMTETKLRYPFDQEVSLTDGFGYRSAPVEGFHDAQDMAAAGGTPIRIVGDGMVTEAGWASDGCGFSLSVQHQVDGQDVVSRYCHMEADSHSWQVGQSVQSGDQAGRVGTTGLSFGNHLHLVMRVGGEAVDPLPFIARNSD